MDPGESLIGPLGWIGWLIGVVAGLLQIYLWRKDRRIGPAKEQLFEEALRDRQGQYSEAQIQDLKALLRRLEDATKIEVPRQARRIFIENQLEAVNDSVASGVKQYKTLSRELEQLTGQRPQMPAELLNAIQSGIVSRSVERARQRLRLYVLVIIILVALTFPQLVDYAVYLPLSQLPSDMFYPFGLENTVYHIIGLVVTAMIAFSLTGPRLEAGIRRHPSIAALVGTISLVLWAGGVTYIGIVLVGPREGVIGTAIVSVVSVVLFGMGLRITQLVIYEHFLRTRSR